MYLLSNTVGEGSRYPIGSIVVRPFAKVAAAVPPPAVPMQPAPQTMVLLPEPEPAPAPPAVICPDAITRDEPMGLLAAAEQAEVRQLMAKGEGAWTAAEAARARELRQILLELILAAEAQGCSLGSRTAAVKQALEQALARPPVSSERGTAVVCPDAITRDEPMGLLAAAEQAEVRRLMAKGEGAWTAVEAARARELRQRLLELIVAAEQSGCALGSRTAAVKRALEQALAGGGAGTPEVPGDDPLMLLTAPERQEVRQLVAKGEPNWTPAEAARAKALRVKLLGLLREIVAAGGILGPRSAKLLRTLEALEAQGRLSGLRQAAGNGNGNGNGNGPEWLVPALLGVGALVGLKFLAGGKPKKDEPAPAKVFNIA